MELELVPEDEPGRSATDSQDEADSAVRYQGPERRAAHRRVTVDRRSMIRFEMTRDRRDGNDRRADLQRWNLRDKL